MPADDRPETILATLDAESDRWSVPCGDGDLVMRSWGEGPPVVLLHGGAGSWRHWTRNIEALAQDRRVIAPDLPGLGDSAAMPHGCDLFAMADLLIQGIDDGLGRGESFDLAGFSFGSTVAGHVASRIPDRIASLTVAGGGALGLTRNAVTMAPVRDRRGAERMAAHRLNLARLMIADPARIDALALAIQSWNSDHARVRSTSFNVPTGLRSVLPHYPGRIAAIYGEQDAIARGHLHERRAFFDSLGSRAAFHAIAGAGHWVSFEAADEFNRLILTILCSE